LTQLGHRLAWPGPRIGPFQASQSSDDCKILWGSTSYRCRISCMAFQW